MAIKHQYAEYSKSSYTSIRKAKHFSGKMGKSYEEASHGRKNLNGPYLYERNAQPHYLLETYKLKPI